MSSIPCLLSVFTRICVVTRCAYYVFTGSVCCKSSGSATGWGQSAVKLTGRVFSALKNIGGSFVAIEDGVLTTTASQNGLYDDCDSAELAEDAALRVDVDRSSETTNDDSVPVIKLDAADVVPLRLTVCTDTSLSDRDSALDDVIPQSSSSVCSQDSAADIAINSFSTSPEFDDRTVEEQNSDDNIVFSSGARRKIRRTKLQKGNKFSLRLAFSK